MSFPRPVTRTATAHRNAQRGRLGASGAILAAVAGTALTIASFAGPAFAQATATQVQTQVQTPAKSPAAGALDKMPLPNDDRLVTGELGNGMKYIVMKHANPPGRAEVWLHVSTGSLNETDKQRGMAHYLEHLAFNGSENFPPGSVVPFFQSLGLSFGRHQNAFTSFDRTVYQLSLPKADAEFLDKSLLFMGDVATKLSLIPAEIDEERQVIMEEKRSRLGAQQRVQEAMLKQLAPGSIVGERLPIGVEETIMGVQEADFRDYYTKYYVPSNMTIMIVADAEPEFVVGRIKAAMEGGERVPVPADQSANVSPDQAQRAMVLTDPELTRASVGFQRVMPARQPSTTVADLRRDMVEQMATAAFDRRLDAKVNQSAVSFEGGGAGVSDLFRSMTLASASATAEPAKWKSSFNELAAEVVRARSYGFTAQEMDAVRSEIIASLERFAAREATMPARSMIGRIATAVASDEPVMSAAQQLELIKSLAPTITPEEVSKSFQESFDPAYMTAMVQLPESAPEVPSEQALLAMLKTAFDVKIEAEAATKVVDSLIAKAPAPAQVSEVSTHEASGVTSAWLSNNVRFHHRYMDYRKNDATITISLAGGAVEETAANRGITAAASEAWSRPATKGLDSTQIRDFMTGKKVNLSSGATGDTLRINVSGDPNELETGMQLAHLLLSQPKVEQAAFDQWKSRQLIAIEGQSKSPAAFFGKLVPETVLPEGEVRGKSLNREQVEAITIENAQAWVDRIIANAPIEVAVVGDISLEKAQQLVATYIGSLPSRERITPDTNRKLRQLPKAKGPRVAERAMPTQTPMAMVLGGFYGVDATNIPDVRAMNLATRVLTTRMIKVIREQEQLVYSISVSSSPATTYPGYGLVLATAPTKPEKAPILAKRIQDMYAEFAANGPTQEEMEVAQRQTANTLDESMKEPSFWMGQLDTITYTGVKLDDVLNAPEAFAAITAEQVKTTFAKYYAPDRTITVSVVPEGEPAAAPGSAPAPAPAQGKP